MQATLKSNKGGDKHSDKRVQRKILKTLCTIGIASSSLAFTCYAHALSVVCFDNPEGQNVTTAIAQWPHGGTGTVDFGPIAQPTKAMRDAEEVIARQTVSFTVQCKNSRNLPIAAGVVRAFSRGDPGVAAATGSALFPTNVQGVMYRVGLPGNHSTSCRRRTVQFPGTTLIAPGVGKYLSSYAPTTSGVVGQVWYESLACNGYFDTTVDFVVELVASNRNFQASSSQTKLDGELFVIGYQAQTDLVDAPISFITGYGSAAFRFGPNQVTPRLCTLTIPNVSMGRISASDIESNKAPEVATEIRIDNCPVGANISLSTVDVFNRSAQSGNVLTLAPSDGSRANAQGIGIELKYKDRPAIAFGAPQNLTASTREGSQDTITLVARYVKNGTGPVLAGQANGQAEITLIHQ